MLQVILYNVVIKFGRLHAVHGREMRGAMGKAVEKGKQEKICNTMVSYHTTLGSVLTYGGNETRRPNLLLVHTYIYIPYPCPGHATEYSFLVYSFPFRDHPFKPSSANSSPLFAVVKLEGSIDDDSIDRCRSKYIHPLILWCEWTVPLGLCTFSKT